MDAVRRLFARNTTPYILRTVHHRVLLRIIGAQCKRPDQRMTSYNRALEKTRCEIIETTLPMRRRLSSERAAGGCRSESCLETFRVQYGEDRVGRRKSGLIASRATFGRLA